jgi:hypothetical protein
MTDWAPLLDMIRAGEEAREASLWALGDALIEECGPPPSMHYLYGAAKELETHGRERHHDRRNVGQQSAGDAQGLQGLPRGRVERRGRRQFSDWLDYLDHSPHNRRSLMTDDDELVYRVTGNDKPIPRSVLNAS